MNYLINQLMTVDKAFYRHYLEMLLTLNRIQALTPGRCPCCCGEPRFSIYRCSTPNCCASAVHGAGKGRDTLYEGMETESTGENNACMAATAVRGDQKGTVERLLVVSVYPERNATQNALVYEHFAWH